MINISIETHPQYYKDYEETLKFLQGINEKNYQYPTHIVNFHVYTEIKNEKEFLSIKSYFATQNLEHTRLILWSDWNISNAEILKPFHDLIDFRVYDPIELAKETILEGNTRQLLAEDSLYYMKSGLLRFIAPYKMGGIWFDMDMVLLRDLVPILDQEFAYMWGSETDFANFGPCAAFLNIHEKSEHAQICLEELSKAPIIPNTVCRDHELLAKVYRRRKFTVFPSTFFNTEWQINIKHKKLGTRIEEGWFKKNSYSDNLFLETFSWHWHNSCFKNNVIEPGSKFDLLTQYIDKKLKERGLL